MEEQLKNFLERTVKLNKAIESKLDNNKLSEKQKKELAELKTLINKAKTDIVNSTSTEKANSNSELNK